MEECGKNPYTIGFWSIWTIPGGVGQIDRPSTTHPRNCFRGGERSVDGSDTPPQGEKPT